MTIASGRDPKKLARLKLRDWSEPSQAGGPIRLFLHPASALTVADKTALIEELRQLAGVSYSFFQEDTTGYSLTVVLNPTITKAEYAALRKKLIGRKSRQAS